MKRIVTVLIAIMLTGGCVVAVKPLCHRPDLQKQITELEQKVDSLSETVWNNPVLAPKPAN